MNQGGIGSHSSITDQKEVNKDDIIMNEGGSDSDSSTTDQVVMMQQ